MTEPALRGEALTRLFDRCSDSVQIVDRQGLTTYVNHAFLTLFAVPDDAAIVGRLSLPADLTDHGHRPDDSHGRGRGLLQALQRALGGDEATVPELALLSFSGMSLWVRADLSPLRDALGTVQGAIIQYRERGDQRHAPEGEPLDRAGTAPAPGAWREAGAIPRELAQGVATIVGLARCIVAMLTPDGQQLVGRAANFTPSAIGLDRIEDFAVDPAQAPLTRAALAGEPQVTGDAATALGPGLPGHRPAVRFGERGLLLVPLRLDEQAFGILYIAADERDRAFGPDEIESVKALARQAALALDSAQAHERTGQLLATIAESKARLDAAINSASEGMVVCDLAGRIVLANAFAHDLYGVAQGRLLGLGPEGLAATLRGDFADGAEFDAAFALGRGGDPEEEWSREYVLARPRSRTVRHVVNPVYDQTGELIGQVVTLHDVTAERAALDARDRLLSIASHELRTPLTSIKGFAQLLQRDLARPESQATARTQHHLKTMLRQLDRLADLVNDLLDVSRIEVGQLPLHRQRCDLVALATEAIERAALMPEGDQYPLTLDTPHDHLISHADPGRIEQVLMNLLDNAITYSPRGSPVRVVLDERDGQAHLAVTDEGIGIPAAQLPTLFEPFVRASNATGQGYSGLGLDLYISRRIVQGHGGRIWVESVEGQGSSFHLLLPMAGDE